MILDYEPVATDERYVRRFSIWCLCMVPTKQLYVYVEPSGYRWVDA